MNGRGTISQKSILKMKKYKNIKKFESGIIFYNFFKKKCFLKKAWNI
jgi:hypothetical protein